MTLDAPEVQVPGPEKIGPSHLERLAVIYVRQSTAQQVLYHTRNPPGCGTDWHPAPGSLGLARGEDPGHRRRSGPLRCQL